MVRDGWRCGRCCWDTEQLDVVCAGNDVDAGLLDELPEGLDPCGENGEFHTCVSDGPMFTAPLALERGHTVLREPAPAQAGDRFAYTDYTLGPCSSGSLPCEGREGWGGVSSKISSNREHPLPRSEEHTSELQSLMRISYAVFCF